MPRRPIIALAAAIASCGSLASAWSADTPDPTSAHAALARGAATEAITLYTELLQDGTLTGQSLAIAYRERGIAQQKAGFTRHAIADYTNALWLDALPTKLKAETYLGRGVAYLELGQLARANEEFGHAIANDRSLAEAYFGRATIKRLQGAPEAALTDYGRALGLNARHPELVHFGRGLAYESLGRRDLALADFRQAAVLAPGLDPVRAKLAEFGAPLPLANGAEQPRAEASPVAITLADAGAAIFAPGYAEEPTGAIDPTGEEVASTVLSSEIGTDQAGPSPQDSSDMASPVGGQAPPLLRPGSDGPLAPESEVAPAEPRAREPAAPNAPETEETQGGKPSTTLQAVPAGIGDLGSLDAARAQAAGPYYVQVASYVEKDSADKGLADLSTRFHELWTTTRLFVETATLQEKGTVYRLRAGPFDSARAAAATCKSLNAQGQDCLILPPRPSALN